MRGLNIGAAALVLPAVLAIPAGHLRRDAGDECAPATVTVTCPAPSTVYVTASAPTVTVSPLSTLPAGGWGAGPSSSSASSSNVMPVHSSSGPGWGQGPSSSSTSSSIVMPASSSPGAGWGEGPSSPTPSSSTVMPVNSSPAGGWGQSSTSSSAATNVFPTNVPSGFPSGLPSGFPSGMPLSMTGPSSTSSSTSGWGYSSSIPAVAPDSSSTTTTGAANSWSTPASSTDDQPTSIPSANTSSTTSTSTLSIQPVGTGSTSKRGIMIPADDPNDTAAYVKAFGSNTPKISWTANFYSGPPSNLSPALSFVPQRYHTAASDDHDWIINANKAVTAGEKYLFSYGEPGLNADVPMTAAAGASFWQQQMQPWTVNATVGAPCMLSTDADFLWLEEFLAACTGCTIGFTTVHWINKIGAGQAQASVDNFKTVIANATRVAHSVSPDTPLWVDNIMGDGAVEDVSEFLTAIVPWLDQNPDVFRYAYFSKPSSDPASVITPDGQLTALGSLFANL